ncbi:brachyurin-like [Cylas formicarius]|uniref:brachyurin-like n=1 Tax=Cylas formicarius TaxID=197179 RepID=UPI0029583F5C|nr:brachyurin-like [Cylas formicarius]
MKLIVLVLCAGLATIHGRSMRPVFYGMSRIVHGNEVAPHSIPYQGLSTFEAGTLCGSILISDTWVLTAAECAYGSRSAKTILGAHNISSPESDTRQVLQSEEVIVHENYSPNTDANDIALIKLAEPAVLTDSVQPAVLPSRNDPSLVGSKGTVSGWGYFGLTNTTLPYNLNAVTIDIIDGYVCKLAYSIYNNETTICSKGETDEGQCWGDAGGPLTVNGKVVGIISYGPPFCYNQDKPTAQTRISYYLDWISEKTGIVFA